MPGEITDLMNEIPADIINSEEGSVAIEGDATGVEDEDLDDADNEDEDQAPVVAEDEDNDDDVTDDDDEEDDDFVSAIDDEDDKPVAPAPTVAPQTPQPQADSEGKYILDNLGKIPVTVVMPTADGKGQELRQFEVYGWGDLPKNMLGFQSEYERGQFTGAAQNNELKARELQTQYRQQKATEATENYMIKENKAIARDLTSLRQDGRFPKFKGVPGSAEFNDSEGAKTFDEVIAFMNEQNDEAGRAAAAGEAFYHVSFKQAYRMLHPEAFDDKGKQAKREADKNMARRVKSGTGSKPTPNLSTKRVSNITDLSDEFAAFAGIGASK